jgi:DHA2 family methylenomycin A resistance protein-like MFS transporter
VISLWGIFVSNVTLTILIIALPVIAKDLPGELSLINWVSLGPLLSVAAITPLAGRAADRFGAKRLWLLGFALTLLGIGASALAPTLPLLIAARLFTGVGSALFVPAALAISSALYPAALRATPIGYWTTTLAISPLLGVLVGGYLTELLGWRMLFVAQLLLGAPVLLAGTLLPAQPRVPGGPFDVQGSIAAAFASGGLLAATTWLGADIAFTPRVGAALLLTALAGVWLVRAEQRAEDPVFPRALLAARPVQLALAVRSAMSFSYMGGFMTLPYFLTSLWGLSQSRIALTLSWRPLAMGVAGALAGRLSLRFGPAALARFGAWLLVLSTLAFVFLDRDPNYVCLTLGLVLAGFGLGIGSPGTVASVSVRVGPELLGSVSALMTLSATLANALGMAGLFAVVEANGGIHDPRAYRASNLAGGAVATLGLWAAYALLRTERGDTTLRERLSQAPGCGTKQS